MDAKYKLWFLIMPAAFLIGISLGSFSGIQIDGTVFFAAASENLASPSLMTDSFLKALWQNIGCAVLLCVFGTTLIGAVPSALLLALRGYGLGQTVSALVSAFGLRGFWAAALGVFPHSLLYVPFLCLLSVCSAGFSCRLFAKDRDVRRHLISYLFTALFLTLPVLLGCLIEGYVSAPLLRSILIPIL